ncbi:MAG: RsiG family protein [Candidatus Geothermincolia bacterium]
MAEEEKQLADSFIDYAEKNDQELREILDVLLDEEKKVSYRRRVLHGKIDMLRAELVRRKRDQLQRGESLISDDDIKKLSEILAGESLGKSKFDPTQ